MELNRKIQNEAQRFLNNGAIGKTDLSELAAACDRIIRNETQRSATEAIELSKKFVKRAHEHGGQVLMTALRAHGWASLVAADYAASKEAYLKARRLARSNFEIRGKIDRILIDVYMYLGNYREAKRRAELALSAFKKLKAGAEIAKTKVNYANVLHRADRHKEAQKLYHQAASFFANDSSDLAAALCWYNLANTETQLLDFSAAEHHFMTARKIFQGHNRDLHATGCLYGLAWLNMLRGEFHTALHQLVECEQKYHKGRHERELVLCQLDRAEVYLGLNLFLDSRREAKRALANAQKLGIRYETAKAQFFVGKSLIGLGRLADARVWLEKAASTFRQDSNHGFLAAAEMSLIGINKSSHDRLAKLKTSRRKFTRAQLPLWEALCDFQIIDETRVEDQALNRLGKNHAVKVVPQLAAHFQMIKGDHSAKDSNMTSAVRYWTKAADILDAVRAKLPPLELSSAFFSSRNEPHLNLIDYQSARNPLSAAAWSERLKTAGLWANADGLDGSNPVRSRIKQTLGDLANEFAAASKLAGVGSGKRSVALHQSKIGQRLQRNLRDYLSSPDLSRRGASESAEIASLMRRTSLLYPILQFHVGGDDIIAFVHHEGECRVNRFQGGGAILRRLVARWRFLVECNQSDSRSKRSKDLQDERELLKSMSDWIIPRLNLPRSAKELLIIPEGQLLSIPWPALEIDGTSLCEKYSICLAPSLRHHLFAGAQKTNSRRRTIFVGASDGLRYLKNEIEVVSSGLGRSRTEVIRPCRRSDWQNQQEADIWHYVGHAEFRADNPFYSSLLLEDGPLFAADFRMKRHAVNLVTLAACRTGQQNFRSGEEASGLVRSLLEMGARSVVASNWAVSDRSTATWMDYFYQKYTVCRSAKVAVQHASLKLREEYPSAYNWSAFLVYGS